MKRLRKLWLLIIVSSLFSHYFFAQNVEAMFGLGKTVDHIYQTHKNQSINVQTKTIGSKEVGIYTVNTGGDTVIYLMELGLIVRTSYVGTYKHVEGLANASAEDKNFLSVRKDDRTETVYATFFYSRGLNIILESSAVKDSYKTGKDLWQIQAYFERK